MKTIRESGLLAASVLFLATITACNTTTQPTATEPVETASTAGPANVPEIRPGLLAGYFTPGEAPDAMSLLPPPPEQGSAAWLADQVISQQSVEQYDSARYRLALSDHDLSFPHAASTFDCAIGTRINQSETPFTYQIMRRTIADAGLSTLSIKEHYQRKRPFLLNNKNSCADGDDYDYSNSGAYPSGHAAVGWAWALILAEALPDQEHMILQRGQAFANSRVVCNLHWQSDVEVSRRLAESVLDALKTDETFMHDFVNARAELREQSASNRLPARDCAVENAAIGTR